jgi:hypothetical protein
MWFWISFSPIGQAPSTPKTKNVLLDDKKIDLQSDAKSEGMELN